ncbi:YybH family protein [candidate division KSB1 bacterium]
MITGCGQGVDIEADVAAIMQMEDGYDRTAAVGDLEGNIAAYTNNVVLMQPNGPTLTGKEAIRAYMKTSFDQFTFESKHVPDKIDIVGDQAIVPGQCTGLITPKSGEDPIPINNKYLHIYRRQPDDTWKLSLSIFNSNDPLPSMEGK